MDQTFSAITLSQNLSVSDFLISFKLSDGYSIRLVDAQGAEVTDQQAAVTDTMKAEVLCNGATVNTYTIAVTAPQEQPTEPTASVPSSTPTDGGNLGIIIGLCVALAMLVIAIVVVLILCKKGILFGKGS